MDAINDLFNKGLAENSPHETRTYVKDDFIEGGQYASWKLLLDGYCSYQVIKTLRPLSTIGFWRN
jgi:hypothetical protein